MNRGIYSITSPSGKQYIGSAVNIDRRWKQHQTTLRHNKHHCAPLQAAADKYGVDSLVFEVLVHLEDITTLITFEQAAFEAYQPQYNICKVAGNTLGCRPTEATRAKLLQRPPNIFTPERRAKMSSSMLGRTHTPEAKAKISAAHLGREHTQEARMNMSLAKVGVAPSPQCIEAARVVGAGRTMSAEQRAIISRAQTGRKQDPAVVAARAAKSKATWAAKSAEEKSEPPERAAKRIAATRAHHEALRAAKAAQE